MDNLTLKYITYLKDTLFEYNGEYGDIYRELISLIAGKQSIDISLLDSMRNSMNPYLMKNGMIDELLTYSDFISTSRSKKINELGIRL